MLTCGSSRGSPTPRSVLLALAPHYTRLATFSHAPLLAAMQHPPPGSDVTSPTRRGVPAATQPPLQAATQPPPPGSDATSSTRHGVPMATRPPPPNAASRRRPGLLPATTWPPSPSTATRPPPCGDLFSARHGDPASELIQIQFVVTPPQSDFFASLIFCRGARCRSRSIAGSEV
jgi:hypothetical protein